MGRFNQNCYIRLLKYRPCKYSALISKYIIFGINERRIIVKHNMKPTEIKTLGTLAIGSIASPSLY